MGPADKHQQQAFIEQLMKSSGHKTNDYFNRKDWTDGDEQKLVKVGWKQNSADFMDDAINADVVTVYHIHPIDADRSLKQTHDVRAEQKRASALGLSQECFKCETKTETVEKLMRD